jgi:ADP-dependent NAD(P)H-hydrate dehydratase
MSEAPGFASSPPTIDDDLLAQWPLPELPEGADKQARGDVTVVGGSRQNPGGAHLAAMAALRVGAGRVQIATVASTAIALSVAFPEARVLGLPETDEGQLAPAPRGGLSRELSRCRALLVGPGTTTLDGLTEVIAGYAEDSREALVLDAGALPALSRERHLPFHLFRGVIATPNAGEMAELWGCSRDDVCADPLGMSQTVARALGATIVLKGAVTFIASPTGQVFRNVAGNVGLATAGSGDVLAGLVAGLLARGAEPMQAAVWAVYLHARAGECLATEVGQLGFLAREIHARVPALLAELAARKMLEVCGRTLAP